MKPEQWGDVNMECFGMLMDGRAQPTGIRTLRGRVHHRLRARQWPAEFAIDMCPCDPDRAVRVG